MSSEHQALSSDAGKAFLGCWPWGTGDAQPSPMGWEDGVGQAAGRRPELHMGFAVMTAPL